MHTTSSNTSHGHPSKVSIRSVEISSIKDTFLHFNAFCMPILCEVFHHPYEAPLRLPLRPPQAFSHRGEKHQVLLRHHHSSQHRIVPANSSSRHKKNLDRNISNLFGANYKIRSFGTIIDSLILLHYSRSHPYCTHKSMPAKRRADPFFWRHKYNKIVIKQRKGNNKTSNQQNPNRTFLRSEKIKSQACTTVFPFSSSFLRSFLRKEDCKNTATSPPHARNCRSGGATPRNPSWALRAQRLEVTRRARQRNNGGTSGRTTLSHPYLNRNAHLSACRP